MSGTMPEVTTSFGAGDNAIPAAVGGGGTAGPSVGAGESTGPLLPPSAAAIELPGLPPQYSTGGGLGFFSRQLESVPTAVAVGPDNALYVSELSGLPYPEGYSRVWRIADPTAGTEFRPGTPGGTPEVYASGFTQINGLSFDGQGNLYVLEYVNGSAIYDPTQAPASLPPSQVIRVAPDGVRTVISGDEMKLGNYVLADKVTGDVFVAINNADTNNGQVLRYSAQDDGTMSYTVAASGLNNPRGMSFGPDGALYILEQGLGTDANDPDAAKAPVIEFIPGLVSERGGYTGSITRLDVEGTSGQERIFTGLASFREFDPVTGADRVVSIGPNGLTITPDGTAFVASGGGLSPATRDALGEFGNYVKGLVRVDGLFDGDASDATITPVFDSVTFAAENGPDGSTTFFNNQSNLNDVVYGTDDKLYTVDAARNVMYGIEKDGLTLDSATVLPKRPPVLTPPQYTAVVTAGGNPTADYKVELSDRTFKAINGSPDTPGRAASLSAAVTALGLPGTPFGSRGEDATVGSVNAANAAGVPGDFSLPAGVVLPAGFELPEGFDPSQIPGFDPTVPGPIDPINLPVRPDNPFTPYFEPFFGNYAPAEKPVLPAGERGVYTVNNLYSFGDRLSDDGGYFGGANVALLSGLPASNSSSVYYEGSFSDGPNWTTHLRAMLGLPETGEDDTNFAYVLASALDVENPLDPFETTLDTFDGQIDAFVHTDFTFTANDLVTVNFGGNDLTLPGGAPPGEAIPLAVQAIVDGLERLADLGAKHFLVTNVANVELAPLFSDPAFLQALGATPGSFVPIVDAFNAQLATALDAFESEAGVDVNLLNANRLFDAIAAEPGAYGFLNVDQPVLAAPPLQPGTPTVYNPAIVGQDPSVQHATLFVDPFFHPTALGHAILAETARSALA